MTQIFVFGSNTAGRHGKGAAFEARTNWGAIQGVGKGLIGRAYAIPTKMNSVSERDRSGNPKLITCTLEQIEISVDQFANFAKANQQYTFLVTEIGCGLAGYSACQIAPLFSIASRYPNVYLPERFLRVLHLGLDRMSFDKYNVKAYIHAKEGS